MLAGQIQIPPQYFSNWDMFGGQATMFSPESPFNPDKGNKKKKKKKVKKDKKKEKKKKKKAKKDTSDESDYEEEAYVLRKPGRLK